MTALRPSVRAVWHAFSEPLEGRVAYMYVDIKGYVTTATGVLIDDLAHPERGHVPALALPWRRERDGLLATPVEITAQWRALKNADVGGYYRKRHHKYAAAFLRNRPEGLLYLDDAALDAIVEKRLNANVAHFVKIFPGFETFPADAQLALCSMAWAVGAGLDTKFPNLTKLVRARDWAGCIQGVDADGHSGSYAAKIREDNNPGVVPRNRANVLCFRNAAAVKAAGADVAVLHWPDTYTSEPPVPFDAGEADTEPAVPHPSKRPQALAGGFSVAEAIVRDGLRDLSEK